MNLAQKVILAEGWRAALLTIASGALSALALAPYHLFPILFFTLPVLAWRLDGAVAPAGASGITGAFARYWPAFRVGWGFGFGYFLAGLWWIGKAFLVDADEFAFLLPVAVIALPAGLALFWGVAAALAKALWSRGWWRLLALATAFAAAEWLRGIVLTGFPWNTIGYAAMPTPLAMQSAGLIGVYAISFFTVLVGSSLAIITPSAVFAGVAHRAVHVKRTVFVALVLIAAHAGYGAYVLLDASDANQPDISLRIVQPALDQRTKWDPARETEIMDRYLGLSNLNKGPQAASTSAFTHIIWPESAFPFVLTQRRDQLARIADMLPPTTQLITGAMRVDNTEADASLADVYNTLYVIDSEGEVLAAADKTHLVPFGEYLPFQNLLESFGLQQLTQLRGGFTAGQKRSPVSVPSTPAFLPLICYEIIYSGAVMPDGERAEWIVNLTNDGWFGNTAGPYQHAHQARVRAVEEGLPVVRAANSGISMVIDAYGRVRAKLALGEQGTVDSALPIARERPFYARTGQVPFLIFICMMLSALVVVKRINTHRL